MMEAQHKQVEQKDLERSVENGTVSQFTMPIRSYIPHGHAVLIIDRFTLETQLLNPLVLNHMQPPLARLLKM